MSHNPSEDCGSLFAKICGTLIDALGTQTAIAAQIIDQNGDYALALKDNQGILYEEVQDTFTLAQKERFAQIQHQFHAHH